MASLRETLAELQQVEAKIAETGAEIQLSFTPPSEVQKQILNVRLAQKKLNNIKQELQNRQSGIEQGIAWQSLINPTGKALSEEIGTAIADSLLGLDPEKRRKRLQREQIFLRNQIQAKISQTIPTSIDRHIERGNRLVTLGQEYLKNPSKVEARIRSEKQKRLRMKLLFWVVVFVAVGLFFLIGISNGQINTSGIIAYLAGTICLLAIAFEHLKKDSSEP